MIDQSRRQKLHLLVETELARWGLTLADIRGPSRDKYVVICRHIIMAMAKEKFYSRHHGTDWLSDYFHRDRTTFHYGANEGAKMLRQKHYPPITGGHHPYFSNTGDHV